MPVLWDLKEHTKGKHLVLKEYLNAWLPILGMREDIILVIDGFAGPGEYIGGEEGSPQIALQAFIKHHSNGKIRNINFYFIEENKKKFEHLNNLLNTNYTNLPKNCKYKVIHGSFGDTLTPVLDEIDADESLRLAPAFVMVDPFGVRDVPMDVVGRILSNPKCEVYVSLMYEAINRHLEHENFEPHLDRLFGCSDWRTAVEFEKDSRKLYIYDLYRQQLKKYGAQHVVNFELYQGKRLVYSIFYATGHPLGCDKMKSAIWKVMPDGDYSFHGALPSDPQLTMSLSQPLDTRPLREQLHRKFADGNWHYIEHISAFVASDETIYHTGQLRKFTLAPMEKEGKLEVHIDSPRKRRGSFPDGTRIRFS